MRALSMSSADAFILVYDVTDSSTFDEARVIRDQIHETKVRSFSITKWSLVINLWNYQATTAVPIVVVGNKIDLLEDKPESREVNWQFYYLLSYRIVSYRRRCYIGLQHLSSFVITLFQFTHPLINYWKNALPWLYLPISFYFMICFLIIDEQTSQIEAYLFNGNIFFCLLRFT